MQWSMSAPSIGLLAKADSSLAAHFYGKPESIAVCNNWADSQVPHDLQATPILRFPSYAKMLNALDTGSIPYPYTGFMYNSEHWADTPVSEQQDPQRYHRLAGQRLHAGRYRAVFMPARNLGDVCTTAPTIPGEGLDNWYLRVDVPGFCARYGEFLIVQSQARTLDLDKFGWLLGGALTQAVAANPWARVFGTVSTNYGSAEQMADAVLSVPSMHGFHVNMTADSVPKGVDFFRRMKAAGL